MALSWGCSRSLDSTFNILFVYCFVLATLCHSTSSNHKFIVRSRNWWTVPNDTACSCDSFDHWARRNRFQVGDTLLFLYDPKEDSVLQVCEEDYYNCKTSEPLQSFKDGNTSFHLCNSGSYYFISGNSDRCQKSEKLHVVVMATRENTSAPAPTSVAAPAPAPPPMEWGNGSSPSIPPPPPMKWGSGSPPSIAPPPPMKWSNGSSPSIQPPPPMRWGYGSPPSIPPPPVKWGNGSSPSIPPPPPMKWGNGSPPSIPPPPPMKKTNESSPSIPPPPPLQFIVGARNWWTVPNDTSCESLNHWAQRNRFQVNDTLVFLYDPREDSVLQVCEEDYQCCKTSEPLQSFKDGNTRFVLNRPGSFYFISGNSERCQISEKLHVVVMATRENTSAPAPVPASVAPPALVPPPMNWGNGSSRSTSPSIPPPPPPMEWGNGSSRSPSPSVPPPPKWSNWSNPSPSVPPPPSEWRNWSSPSPSVPPPPSEWNNGSSPTPSVPPPPSEWSNGSSPSPSVPPPPVKWGNLSSLSPSHSPSPSVPPPPVKWGNLSSPSPSVPALPPSKGSIGSSPSPFPSPSPSTSAFTTLLLSELQTETLRVQVNTRIWEEAGGSSMTILVAVVCYMFFM